MFSTSGQEAAATTSCIRRVQSSLADAEEVARSAQPADDPGAQLRAIAAAYREWAVANPAEFQLIYGDPVPGYQMPEEGPAREAAHRACALLTDIVALGWTRAAPTQSAGRAEWGDFDPVLAKLVRRDHPELPAEGVVLSLRIWGRIHGLVTLEVYGHLANLTLDPAKVFTADMEDLSTSSAGESQARVVCRTSRTQPGLR
jgi:hypothetical protein